MSDQAPDQSPFTNLPEAGQAGKKGLSGCAIAGIGCGVVVLMLLIAGGFGAWWLKNNGRQLGTNLVVTQMKEGLQELDVPEDQRVRMEARIDEVGQMFTDGQLDLQQVGTIFEGITESPLMSAGMSLFFKRAYLDKSGLSDAEKADAQDTSRRFIRGSIDQAIPRSKTDEVLDLISTRDGKDNREFRESLTDDELKAFVTAMRTAADEAGVAEDVPEINFADEFDDVIDRALAGAGVGDMAGVPAEAPDEEGTDTEADADAAAESETDASDSENGITAEIPVRQE